MSQLKPAKVFDVNSKAGHSITSLHFDDRGEYLISASTEGMMELYNAREGKQLKQIPSFKYGAHLARFTHSSKQIIHASTKEDDAIRLMDLTTKGYVRYFRGHSQKVCSVEMSPTDDSFLSGSVDDTVRFWDLRAQKAQGQLNIAGRPCVAYDPSGMVFAVALNLMSSLLMYATQDFDKAPFLSKSIVDPLATEPLVFTSICFSNDGNMILIGTAGDVHYVLDAYDGNTLARLTGPPPSATVPHHGISLDRNPSAPYDRPLSQPPSSISGEELAWTPDGRFVVGGSVDGKVHVWDVKPPEGSAGGGGYGQDGARPEPGPHCTLYPVASLEGHQAGPSRAVAFNPRAGVMATGGRELALWLPDLQGEGSKDADGA